MYIIGVNASHNATAALLKDGKIISCISEERLTGYKNETGLPLLSIKYLLNQYNLTPQEIDFLVFGMKNPTTYIHFRQDNNIHPKITLSGKLISSIHPPVKNFIDNLLIRYPNLSGVYEVLYNLLYIKVAWPPLRNSIYKELSSIGFSKNQIKFLDHHFAHAASAYLNMPDSDKGKVLVLTADGVGDGLCASVNIFEKNGYKRIAKTSNGNSLAFLYGAITQCLGMKLNDHEYKVMGLAAYTTDNEANKGYEKIRDLMWVDETELTFKSLYHSDVYLKGKILKDRLFGTRFDYVAGGIQKLVEQLGTQWVRASIKRTKIKRVALAGGLFMNIKLNKKIMELDEVEQLYIMPSCGDESTAISAAQAYYWQLSQRDKKLEPIEPIEQLYLGPEYSNKQILDELKKIDKKKFRFSRVKDIEKQIAKLLSGGQVVARFADRMEFGARALGNRSILANPSDTRVVRIINEQIKSRDFWMPFACSVLKEREKDYVINPKKVVAPYMILSFDTTKKAQQELIAGMHQFDLTIRPQVVEESVNSSYYKVIKEFEKLTGIGGVLNTSFNLHGYPIVCTPKDALYVLENSGLKYLTLGDFLVEKID